MGLSVQASASLQIGSMDPFGGLQGPQSGADFQAMLRAHHHHHHHHGQDNNQQGQQAGQIGQSLMQTGQQLIQQGQQLIQQGDYQDGMQLIKQGAQLEQQGAQLEQQATQGTDPFNQYSSDALSSNNNSQDPLQQLLQTVSQLAQQAGQIESGMGLTSLMSSAGPLLGALMA
jgi:hypothetical protein